jgi:hypothetical protein
MVGHRRSCASGTAERPQRRSFLLVGEDPECLAEEFPAEAFGGRRQAVHGLCFQAEEDEHLLAVLRDIERNPLRAGLVGRAEEWPWSSLCWLSAPTRAPMRVEPGILPRGTLWVEGVNPVTTDVDPQVIRESVRRDRPLGSSGWTLETAKALNLEYSFHPRKRPKGVEPAPNDKTT